MQIYELACTMWKRVELHTPLIFPVDAEDTFLELHTLPNLFEVPELARYIGNSKPVKELLRKQIQEPKTP